MSTTTIISWKTEQVEMVVTVLKSTVTTTEAKPMQKRHNGFVFCVFLLPEFYYDTKRSRFKVYCIYTTTTVGLVCPSVNSILTATSILRTYLIYVYISIVKTWKLFRFSRKYLLNRFLYSMSTHIAHETKTEKKGIKSNLNNLPFLWSAIILWYGFSTVNHHWNIECKTLMDE